MRQFTVKSILKQAIVAVIVIGMMLTVSACSIRPFGWSDKKISINQEEKLSLENLKMINISTASADIKVIVTNDKELKFHYYGELRVASTNKGFAPYIDIDESGTSLVLMEKIRNGFNSVSYRGSVKLDIYIPEKYTENLKLNTASGDVSIKDFQGSGDINTASGDIDIENCRESFDANTVSGDINYKRDSVLNNNLSLNTVSGDVSISIEKESEFSLKARTVSGKIRCDFPVILQGRGAEGKVGSGKNSISVNTVSGDIILKSN
jgi:lia operon protein LiaG